MTNNKLTDERVSNATLIRLIQWADQHNSHYVAAALCELQERRKADNQEPAGYHVIKECRRVGCSVATLEEAEKTRDFWNKKWTIRPYFYSAAPAPVVPEECPAELPYAQVKTVADLFALCWQSGEVVTYTPDPEKATIWLNNYSGTCVQEYVKLERLQEALAGNSPVIPDDWVMVPKEPTRQMMAQGHFAMKGTDRGKFRRIYQAMITAASALNKGEY
ncbi:hypothetical protein FKD67_01830 [Salmonella enterica]|uniref:Eaa protein n=1 Tax=Salmonella enterica subsp. enterica serovar 4,[5],12:b:- TaxID=1340177 RepID=A0A736HTY2_SALET|nr:hypothetical protein [Salmonella enterica]EBQ5847732.1 hypothetical protein [Salmonella enterica subsp. enterica serovar Virchow]EBZ4665100.1 hypothetical protein [Salmonella enterica subsp. enterica serovar Bovismorbificans]ECF0895516.1 hypothetical protein [Salmonella enterica subsp. enterica serovar Java]EDT1785746.1 hypothetical protein [Salmonella enterica subsp. enterica serovar Schleissheim]EEJ2264433.1 hypothetical protein [Salmonella enterica subsp. enterica]HAE7569880.1 hypotheti